MTGGAAEHRRSTLIKFLRISADKAAVDARFTLVRELL